MNIVLNDHIVHTLVARIGEDIHCFGDIVQAYVTLQLNSIPR